ncbi:di-trans,poly-cis-decaprenylcistransferase [Candidatus Wirthbacteria bacterium CG2_30_54_11]|uniref:Isoprenyl transferase n=1 Tax=Candidatus Wirthbacteria bacterium CG2_30_54_11 TaxID=1817892 RepID=A0A1J5ITI2_9BACT|nr:MAG: di-trans,poly-cis-decaprenylcistransferase [Candidatus Wirthbacteria bacterium CG2_30_54_11]
MKHTTKLEQIRSRPDRIPAHVGVIMDGNRRWAREHHLPLKEGYVKGAEKSEELFTWALDAGVRELSIWVWSTENFNRDQGQVRFMMNLFSRYIKKALKDQTFRDKMARVRFIGRVDLMPNDIQKLAHELEEETAHFDRLTINVCMAYGGRDEIVQAAREIAREVKKGTLSPDAIDEKLFFRYLAYQGVEPDLIIRTSGEERTSGFLLWHTAYSEWYFEPKYMPALTVDDFYTAILDYQGRERRFGA